MQLEINPPKFVFHGEGGKPLVTLHPDGRVEVAEGCSLDAATSAFWEALETAGFQRMNDALASLTREMEAVRDQLEEAYDVAAGVADEGAYYGGNRTDAEGLARDIASAIRHKGRDLRAQSEACLSRDDDKGETNG